MAKITSDPAVRSLLNRMPEEVQKSFTEEQLVHLKVAIGARQWGRHSIDSRGVVKFFKYRYYFVFLAGRNRRELNENEKKVAWIFQVVFITILTLIFIIVMALILYLIKSALGINLFDDFSLGIWHSFKSLFV
ncbi:3-phosphoshikimate 1-carboxyvinyltransferase [Pseudoalteromonas sp. CST5]|uniref:3-phosphoshikimate 1-carboxyvinyltransferase n=1 Tax=unclassified Pseudoalteromonas TaxID=194690 RepID=UPI0023592293|nr:MULTISPECIES: 3-phosphoshikimate 1-carboxyvinyltransferase [unclassified Pseudoalteromonas]MDC9514552.1 3-phosphoshikimate 1-carboxyvinyltransferase [Pseudoalteromonas sp. CST1]MDC9539003.1 3-phosphoshikimate 1-carboxyvinyltransferase [Pseudoalteromonas sp. CST3]MDC9541817.1 3-phosphoshikimate 1-carboxyvinyltransferase [Pseudoalteromonas sp. CST2]MDC9546520.1 3-phosphoshikimate 1-carboxyvinyltransferase [Pseudoalteromonas sp. CST4]MDC9550724.1 3-phosphoshikimate 1-carboxyvinyltransferase [P